MLYTITVFVETDENPRKWDLAEVLDGVKGWDIEEGHGDCHACALEEA